MANRSDRLALHEEVLLLALNDEKGTVTGGTWYNIALGSAVLSELLMREIAEVQTEGKKSYLKLLSRKLTGDEALDAAIERIDSAKRRATLETWVSRLSGLKNLRHRVARMLCEKDILRADEKQILLIFRKRVYPERDHGPEKEIIARLSDAIFGSGMNADYRTIVLLSLANSSELLKVVFDRKKLKSRAAHIDRLIQESALHDATQSAVQSAQAAIMIAVLMPAITTTTIHS